MSITSKVKEVWEKLTNAGVRPLSAGRPTVSFRNTLLNNLSERLPMKSYLKVKIKSLAEEATIIRKEERRVKRSIQWWQDNAVTDVDNKETTPSNFQPVLDSYRQEYFGLHSHRTYEVRNESRAAQLAYAFIQGYPYSRVEDPTRTRKPIPTVRIADLALKYGKVNLPPDTPFARRRDQAVKIIQAWSEGKTTYLVLGTNGQVARPVQTAFKQIPIILIPNK